MVDRVLIQGGKLSCIRVSMPGVDVKTAGLSQLAFDAQFANLSVYQRGFVNVPGQGSVTIGFGETLRAPPICVCTINRDSPFYTHNSANNNETFALVTVSTSGARFEFWAGVGPLPVWYVLFRQLR